MEHIEIVGRVGKVTEKSNDKGSYLDVSVAVSRGFGQNQQTIWYRFFATSKVKDFLETGTIVSVDGEPSFSPYIDKNGEAAISYAIAKANMRIEFKPKKDGNQQPLKKAENKNFDSTPMPSDEGRLPF